MRLTWVVLISIAAITITGSLLIVDSLGRSATGTVVIRANKGQQFSYGLTLFAIGAAGLAFVAWFYAVNGKNSVFRRRPNSL